MELSGYVREVDEIIQALSEIAYPPTHHPHDRRDHHYYSSSHHSLLFPSWDPHRHKALIDPHFHDLRSKWDTARDGISHTFADLKYRLDKKVKDEAKRKAERDKADKEKKDDKARCEKETEEAVRKVQDIADALQKKLDEEQKHQEKVRDRHERIEEHRDDQVERLVDHKLQENPIQEIGRIADVMGHIQRVITPRSSHHGLQLSNFNNMGQLPGYCPYCQQSASSTCQCSSNNQYQGHSHRARSHSPIMIQNVIQEQVQDQDQDQDQDQELSDNGDPFTVESYYGDDNDQAVGFHHHDHSNARHHGLQHHRHSHPSYFPDAHNGGHALRHPERRPATIEYHGQPGLWVPFTSDVFGRASLPRR